MKLHTCPLFLILLWIGGSLAEELEPCTYCSKVTSENELTRSELLKIRLELIKQKILQKLHLKEPPKIKRPVLPEPLVNGYILSTIEDRVKNHESSFTKDDFYSTTQSVIILPDNTTTHNCYTRDEMKPSSCFRFRLTHEMTTRSIKSAELFVHKTRGQKFNEQGSGENPNIEVTYTVAELTPHPGQDTFSESVIAIEESQGSPGWLKFELGPAVRTWALQNHMTHALEVSCKGCDLTIESPVSLTRNLMPFLMIHTDSWRPTPRQRRSLVCSKESTHCCKENFQINFKDISWDKWIIHPTSYSANFCRGSCLSDLSAARYHHTTVIRRFIRKHPGLESNLSMALCCTPSKMSPLTLIYMDERKNIFKKTLPNMIVDSCDCA